MVLLDDACSIYLKERERARTFAATTVPNVRSQLGLFARWCQIDNDGEPLALEAVRSSHVERWLASQRVVARTAHNRLSAIRTLFEWARRRGLVEHDPTDGVRAPRLARDVPRAFSASAVSAVLECASSSRERLIVSLMVQEGLRCCEVANLRVQDIDREAGELIATGKGGHQRVLPITTGTARAMDVYLAEWPAPAFGPLVRKYRDPLAGLRANWVSKVVRQVLTDAGVKHLPGDGASAHALRHTAASDVLDACGDLRVVQEMLGHSSLTSTQRYLRRASAAQLRVAMNGRTYRPVETAG